MPSASLLRSQIEATLADRIPSALTPVKRLIRPLASTGIPSVDDLLGGGLPLGALTEISGPECSGRTSLALAFLAQRTREDKACAWIDASDTFAPESAAASGIHLPHLLWIRCGAASPEPQASLPAFTLPPKYLTPSPPGKGLHGGGCGDPPRNETRGLSAAVEDLFAPPRDLSTNTKPHISTRNIAPLLRQQSSPRRPATTSARLDQALRVTDLLLQAGGFSTILIDMGSIPPELVSRIPLATWFRYRAAAERTQTCILLLSQYPCAKSSAELALQLQASEVPDPDSTLVSEISFHLQRSRGHTIPPPTNLLPLRKSPTRSLHATWSASTPQAGVR